MFGYTSVNQEISNQEILLIFESQLNEILAQPTKKAYKKAVRSITVFLKEMKVPFLAGSKEFLESWMIYMSYSGLSQKTALQYFNAFSALYSSGIAKGMLPPASDFHAVKARLLSLAAQSWENRISEGQFAAFRDKIQRLYLLAKKSDLITDIVVFWMLNPQLSLLKIAGLTTEDNQEYFSRESLEIIQRNRQPRHKYIFDFDQSRLTANQLRRLVEQKVEDYFYRNAIPMYGNIQETLKTYWAYLACQAKIEFHYIQKTVGFLPNGFPILELCSPVNVPENELLESYKRAAGILMENPRKWFVVKLRRGKKYDDFVDFATTNGSLNKKIELFNPVDRIPRKKNGKMKIRKVPFLGSLFMVRTTKTELHKLLKENSDFIIPYRSVCSKGGGYLEIPDSSMRLFQATIGQFTDDMEFGPVGSLTLHPGDRVVVIGGAMAGYEGELVKTTTYEKGIIYRIKIFGDSNDIEWKLKDLRLIEKIKK